MENIKSENLFLDNKDIVIALSGGIDSVVLLHYLRTNFDSNLRAVHCNHHLSDYCDEWDKFCKNLCKSNNIEYSSVDIFLENEANLEEIARKKRYHSLSSILCKDEILCTAHHMDDQSETILLQLLRGSGVAGLSSMPRERLIGEGLHYRPFLNVNKSQIIEYAAKHKLQWIEDDSNVNTDFRRNFLRSEIIPKLSSVYTSVASSLSRSARHQSEALKLIRDLALIDINENNLVDTDNCIDIKKLCEFEQYRIINIIRYHINSLKFLPPSEKVMKQITRLLVAKEDANPLTCWGSFEVRRYQGRLHFIGNILDNKINTCPFYKKLKSLPNFSIRYRKDGQRVKLSNKSHSQSLKKVLQEASIPPWERDKLRMYYIDDRLRAMERIGELSESN